MNRRNHTGAGLFLMEMIAAVCGFILCASLCILAFAKSDRMSRLAKDRGAAVSAAQSAAEIWKAEGIDGLQLRMKAVPSGLTDGTGQSGDNAGAAETDSCEYRILWDRNWETLDAASDLTPAETAGGARYAADLQVQEGEDGIWKLSISIGYTGGAETEPLFELDAARYVRPQG